MSLSGKDKGKASVILANHDPYELMELGKKLAPGPDWNKGSTKLLYSLLQQKFSEETRARSLTRTDKWHLYECTFHPVYGVGRHPGNVHTLTQETVKGGNLLGKLLEKVRGELLTKQDSKGNNEPPPDKENIADPQPPAEPTGEAEKTDDETANNEKEDDTSTSGTDDDDDDPQPPNDLPKKQDQKGEDKANKAKSDTPLLDLLKEVEEQQQKSNAENKDNVDNEDKT